MFEKLGGVDSRKINVRDIGEVVFVVFCFLNCDWEIICIRII